MICCVYIGQVIVVVKGPAGGAETEVGYKVKAALEIARCVRPRGGGECGEGRAGFHLGTRGRKPGCCVRDGCWVGEMGVWSASFAYSTTNPRSAANALSGQQDTSTNFRQPY